MAKNIQGSKKSIEALYFNCCALVLHRFSSIVNYTRTSSLIFILTNMKFVDQKNILIKFQNGGLYCQTLYKIAIFRLTP